MSASFRKLSGESGESQPLLPNLAPANFHCERGLDYYRNLEPINRLFNEKLLLAPKLHLDKITKKGKIQASLLMVTETDKGAQIYPNDAKMSQMMQVNFERPERNAVFTTKEPQLLHSEGGFRFWKLPFKVRQGETLSYIWNGKVHTIQAPGDRRNLKAVAFSCNGRQTVAEQIAHDRVGGVAAAWSTVLSSHERSPKNLMLGGGDQLYCDDIFEAIPQLNAFRELPLVDKITYTSSEHSRRELKAVLKEYLIRKYCNHLSKPNISDMFAKVLSILTWDDHDIFDGYGSYSPDLQNCQVFQDIFEVSKEMYELFQQHYKPTEDLPDNRRYLGNGYTQLINLGKAAILNLDGRSERTRTQVLSHETLHAIKEAIEALPSECDHIIVQYAIPMVYPDLSVATEMLPIIQNAQESLGLENDPNKLVKEQHELEDDLGDEPRSPGHINETEKIVQMFQQVGKRVTIVSGDVHLATVGEIRSDLIDNPTEDPALITNLTTSPICNKPPKPMASALNILSKIQFGNEGEDLGNGTSMHMTEYHLPDGRNKGFIAKQNWLELELVPSNLYDTSGNLECRLHTYDQPLEKTGFKKAWQIFIETFFKRPINFAHSLLHCCNPDARPPFPIERGAIQAYEVYYHTVPGLNRQASALALKGRIKIA